MIEMFGAWRAMQAKRAADAAEEAQDEAVFAKARADGTLAVVHTFVPLSFVYLDESHVVVLDPKRSMPLNSRWQLRLTEEGLEECIDDGEWRPR